MFKNIISTVNTKYGKIIISIILGLGLASIFRKSCETRNCIVFNAPPFEEVKQNIYKHDNKCFKYEEENIMCNSMNKQIQIA
tara:strand:- start:7446 stop:7691 length:246 start_codon:yes stop_codon:yes gene_type:complete